MNATQNITTLEKNIIRRERNARRRARRFNENARADVRELAEIERGGGGFCRLSGDCAAREISMFSSY